MPRSGWDRGAGQRFALEECATASKFRLRDFKANPIYRRRSTILRRFGDGDPRDHRAPHIQSRGMLAIADIAAKEVVESQSSV